MYFEATKPPVTRIELLLFESSCIAIGEKSDLGDGLLIFVAVYHKSSGLS
jgi:hypothetical protein